jgi:LuxR family transcriptional regulator, glucitol operon activator
MAFNATRLTCFALLSALEEDLRTEIENYVGIDDAADVLPAARLDSAQLRRAKDYPGTTATSLGALLPYLDFADSYEILNRESAKLPNELQEQLRTFTPRIERVTAIRNRVAHTRPMEIDDLPNILDLARALCTTPGTRWPTLRATLMRLNNEPAYVLGLTVTLPSDPDPAPQHNLPVPDFDETGFFGRKAELTRIKKALKGPYPVVSVLGDGGIGKTSIALKAAYELLDDAASNFEVVVWVTAKATTLTLNEIKHISNAIQDSLGLFAAATKELGALPSDQTDPVSKLLEFLENFKVLLILDNLETVLDSRLRSFLLDLPVGSKVLITSRIGLGIENPVNLAPLTNDDATRLLRALARVREVKVITTMDPASISNMVTKIKGHPAFIKWLVAGVQSGKRPSDLVSNNALLLDFCMSNVYGQLSERTRAVLRSMQVLQGPRSQAELSYINDVNATAIQAALLELMTTNFVSMMSQSTRQALDTTYQVSDFAKQYLDKRHAVSTEERNWLLERSRKLIALGASLRAAGSSDPYSPETVDIRSTEDFHVARLLRDALRSVISGNMDQALENCREAQLLAPAYHEAWRVEAYVQTARTDISSALTAYERAIEIAPDSATLKYFFGTFLLYDGGDPRAGLALLQSAAKLDATSPEILSQITWAHLAVEDFDACIETALHLIEQEPLNLKIGSGAPLAALRAAFQGADRSRKIGDLTAALTYVESGLEVADSAAVEYLLGEPSDRLLQLGSLASGLVNDLDENFAVTKAREFVARLHDRVRVVDPFLLERRIGAIANIVWEKYFAFIEFQGKNHFFHYRDLMEEQDWSLLRVGAQIAFRPFPTHHKGPRALEPRLLP